MTAPIADHPHSDPGDGRSECARCGKWVWPAIHSCKGMPVTYDAAVRHWAAAEARAAEAEAKLRAVENEIHHAQANGHRITGQGVGPGERVPGVRIDYLRAVLDAGDSRD